MLTTEIVTTVIGNLTDDPELKFTPSGVAVATFTVANNVRRYDKDAGEWVDGDASFIRCTVWRDLAENVAASLKRGNRVLAHGQIVQENWEDKEGNKRSALKLNCNAVGADLSYAQATVKRITRSQGD